MRQPDNRRDAELFDEIFADRDRAAEGGHYRLTVGGAPLVPSGLSASRDSGAPAFVLDASLPVPLGREAKRKEVRVDLLIAGVLWHDYKGACQVLTENEDGSGAMSAATAGFYQGGDEAATKFGEKTAYNTTRAQALSDMLRRFPYDRIEIPDLPGDFVRQGADAFQMVAPVGEGIEAVTAEALVEQFDTPMNAARVENLPTLSSLVSGGPLVRWTVGKQISGFSATSRAQAEFRDVDVVIENPAGDFVSVLENPIEVRYPPGVEPPPVGTTHHEQAEAGEDVNVARARGAALARSFGYGGEWDVSITLPYIDPRIEDYDEREVARTNAATGLTEIFRCRVLSQDRDYSAWSMTLNCVGAMVWQEPARPERIVIPERSGVGGTANVSAAFASDLSIGAMGESTIEELS